MNNISIAIILSKDQIDKGQTLLNIILLTFLFKFTHLKNYTLDIIGICWLLNV